MQKKISKATKDKQDRQEKFLKEIEMVFQGKPLLEILEEAEKKTEELLFFLYYVGKMSLENKISKEEAVIFGEIGKRAKLIKRIGNMFSEFENIILHDKWPPI